jgi:hypothetical protein
MAIVKFGTSVVGIRKTLGGVTFSKSSAGPTARPWRPSTMAWSAKQTAQQANFPALVQFWRALTPAEKADWATFGQTPPETDTNSLGLTYKLSGWQWYCRVNTRIALIAGTRLDTPPVGGVVSPPTTVSIAADTDPVQSLIISFDELPFDDAPYAVVYVKFAPRSGISLPHSGFYLVDTADVSGTTSLNITTKAKAIFGNMTAGDSLFLRLRCMTEEGLRSTLVTAATVAL